MRQVEIGEGSIDSVMFRAVVTNGNKFAIYSYANRRLLNEYIFDIIEPTSSYDCLRVCRNGKWGLFDAKSLILAVECEYYEGAIGNAIPSSFVLNGEYPIPIKVGEKYDFLIRKTNQKMKQTFDYAGMFIYGIAMVIDKGSTKYIKPSLNIVFEGCSEGKEFSKTDPFAAICLNGKWGFINTNGEVVILPQYDCVDDFSEGLAGIKNGGFWGYINKNNKLVIPSKYRKISKFSHGKAQVSQNMCKEFCITKKGEQIETEREWEFYSDDEPDYHQDTWDAMTDGMYGDMPDGFDGDYDFLGF